MTITNSIVANAMASASNFVVCNAVDKNFLLKAAAKFDHLYRQYDSVRKEWAALAKQIPDGALEHKTEDITGWQASTMGACLRKYVELQNNTKPLFAAKMGNGDGMWWYTIEAKDRGDAEKIFKRELDKQTSDWIHYAKERGESPDNYWKPRMDKVIEISKEELGKYGGRITSF